MSDPACRVADERSPRVRPAVSAIYGIFRCEDDSEGDDGGELVGTGLFVTMRDRPCILTAAHVALKKDERTTTNERLFVGLAHTTANGSPPAYIRSQYLCLGPPEDLAVALADAQALQQSAVVPVNLGQFADEPEDGDFFVLGFPGANSHFTRLLDAIQSTALPLLSNRSAGDPWFVVTPSGRRAMVGRIAALSLR